MKTILTISLLATLALGTEAVRADVIIGNATDQTLEGSGNDDIIDGRGGADVIYGYGGNDDLFGGNGKDEIRGGSGDDRIAGGGNADYLYANSGNDILFGENGADRLYGGNDNDYLVGGAGNDRLFGQNGNDLMVLGDGRDRATGGAGSDVFFIDIMDDKIDILIDFMPEDYLDLSSLFIDFIDGVSEMGDYVAFMQDGDDTLVQIDRDGQADGFGFADLLLLRGVLAPRMALIPLDDMNWSGDDNVEFSAFLFVREVPAPGALSLALLGFAGLGLRRRRGN